MIASLVSLPPRRNTGTRPPPALPGAPASPAGGGAGANIVTAVKSPEELREQYVRLRKAVAEEPDDVGHWLLLADTCLRLGRTEEAKGLLVKTVEREPRCRSAALDLLGQYLGERDLARVQLGAERTPFYQDAAAILNYPLRRNGPALLVGGGLVFTGLAVLSRITTIFFWIPALFTLGYLASYTMTIIESSSRGNPDPPDYPDFSNFWDSVLGPFWIAVSASLIPSALPVAYLLVVGPNFGVAPCIALGLIYWPMALVAGATFQSALVTLDLPRVVRAIRICGKEYFLGILVMYGLVLVSILFCLLAEMVLHWLASAVMVQILGLYFLLMEMHLLGRIYRNHEPEIGWFRK